MFPRPQWARSVQVMLFAGSLCVFHSSALAQHGGGGGGGGGMGGGRPPMGGMPDSGGGVFGRDRGGFPGDSPDGMRERSITRPGLQLGPPGRWWDDKHFAKTLQLRPEQQRRMDAAFETSRSVLLKRFGDLEQQQSRMETLVRAKNLDEGALFAQIDRIAEARAELEKANTHLLLQLRGEMDADQIARLEQQR